MNILSLKTDMANHNVNDLFKDKISRNERYTYLEYIRTTFYCDDTSTIKYVNETTQSEIYKICMYDVHTLQQYILNSEQKINCQSYHVVRFLILNATKVSSIDTIVCIYEWLACKVPYKILIMILDFAYIHRRQDIINKFARYLTLLNVHDTNSVSVVDLFYYTCNNRKLLCKHVDLLIQTINITIMVYQYTFTQYIKNPYCDDNLVLYIIKNIIAQIVNHANTLKNFSKIIRDIYAYRSHELFINVINIMKSYNIDIPSILHVIYNSVNYTTNIKTLKYVLNVVHKMPDFKLDIDDTINWPSPLLMTMVRYKHGSLSYQQTYQLLNLGYHPKNIYAKKLIEKHEQRLFIFAKIINENLTHNIPTYDINITNIMKDYVHYEDL